MGVRIQPRQKTDPQLKSLLQDLEMVPPLEPREALYEGRTGAATLYAKAEEEDIKYSDVASLYSFVNKYKEYPVLPFKRFAIWVPGPANRYEGI